MSEQSKNPNDLRLTELYQEVILDHNRRPRNYGKLEQANSQAHGINPLCGDDYHLYIDSDEKTGIIKKIGFEGQGCAISKASASILTTMIVGKTHEEAIAIKDHFIRFLLEENSQNALRPLLGHLKIFEGVRQYPIRVKCATLIWRALEEALKKPEQRKTDITTEDKAHETGW